MAFQNKTLVFEEQARVTPSRQADGKPAAQNRSAKWKHSRGNILFLGCRRDVSLLHWVRRQLQPPAKGWKTQLWPVSSFWASWSEVERVRSRVWPLGCYRGWKNADLCRFVRSEGACWYMGIPWSYVGWRFKGKCGGEEHLKSGTCVGLCRAGCCRTSLLNALSCCRRDAGEWRMEGEEQTPKGIYRLNCLK